MSAQRPVVAPPANSNGGDFSVVATRLVEAACFARDGNCEAAKAQIARAMALLRGEPSTIPRNSRSPTGDSRDVVRGSLATWQKRRIASYIDAHLTDTIRVTDLAELLNLSESHFSRAFRCTFGTSAHEYVIRRRVEVAQSLMLKSRDPLCAIALHCGLSDQSHFTRVFRRIVGETPYVWRRARWGEIDDQRNELLSSLSNQRRDSVLSKRAELAS